MAAVGGGENFHRQDAKTPEEGRVGVRAGGVLSRDSPSSYRASSERLSSVPIDSQLVHLSRWESRANDGPFTFIVGSADPPVESAVSRLFDVVLRAR